MVSVTEILRRSRFHLDCTFDQAFDGSRLIERFPVPSRAESHERQSDQCRKRPTSDGTGVQSPRGCVEPPTSIRQP